MFATKSLQLTRPGPKKPKPKRKKRSLTTDQPRLRRAELDSRAYAPSQKSHRSSHTQGTSSLLALPQIPNIADVMASSGGGSPRNLQDVISNFMWAKQQASAAASVMSNLRGVIEGMGSQPEPGSKPAVNATSSAGTTYLLPGDTKSQLAASSRQLAGHAENEGSEVGSALRSVSETALAADAAAAEHADHDQPDDVGHLRKQFQLQQARLRQMEQKNYVLSLAVEGQEKTIRTMSNELQDAKEAFSHEVTQRLKRDEREAPPLAALGPAQLELGGPDQQGVASQEAVIATLSTQSWPMASTKTEILQEDNHENRREVDRLNAILESKERELNILKASRQDGSMKSYSTGKARPMTSLMKSHLPNQAGFSSGWKGQLDGTRTRSSELHRPAVGDGLHQEPAPLRRHSFTVPPPRSEDAWRGHVGAAHVNPLHSRAPLFAVREPSVVAAGPRNAVYEGRCQELKETVEESLARVRELEAQLFELKCSRDRGDNIETPLLGNIGLPGLAELGPPTTGPSGLCKPFPQILRMTETKLQQAYQSLLTEQHKNKLLNKNLHEAATRLDQHGSQMQKLKEKLTVSLEERRQLQTRLADAEAANAEAQRKLQELREELHRKTELLVQTSQHLDDRIEQVASLSRELDATRSEAAHESRLAAERLSELRTHAGELEARAAKHEADSRQLRQASEEASHLAQSERRLRQRVLELQGKLDQSTSTAKMLENYVLFLKSSYSKMFGTPTPVPSPGFDVPPSIRDLLEQTEGH
ncbi:outer dense fiber protein 2-like [Pollicipes pollicipes]|uniref:outer dense fiber protein 2-like n=1 Tax=Pollicipes pollicipes TaxID=41117 RepID=UPI001885972C|nr:outer dense fiber protein 2-like [Pollicipes pollicipes]